MNNTKTIVVGYDGSGDARRAVAAAGEMVAEDGVVHIVVAYKAPSEAERDRMWKQVPEEFHSVFDVLSVPQAHVVEAEKLLDGMGASHLSRMVEGHAASAILDTVDEVEADLVVVGSRGLGRAARFVRGSVSTRVANNAHTSVLIVHPDDN